MTFHCFICQQEMHSIDETCSHLRREHGLFDGQLLLLKCCRMSCDSHFQTYKKFREHLRSHLIHVSDSTAYNNCSGPKQQRIVLETESPSLELENSISSHNTFNHYTTDTSSNVCSKSSHLDTILNKSVECETTLTIGVKPTSLFEKFVLNLDTLSIPKTIVDEIVKDTSSILNEVFNKISGISLEDNIPISPRVKEYISLQKKSITNMSSNYKRNKVRENKANFVAPTYFSIGTRTNQKFDRRTGVYISIPVPCTAAYISILETVKFVLSNDSVKKVMFNNSVNQSGNLSSFRDGLYYKKHPFFKFNFHNLAIQLYFDEFETVNPLGSKTGGHKIGGIYCVFCNLPHHFNAQLENIHLVSLFYSVDAKEFGLDKIMTPIINDFKILETKGIEIGDETIRGTIGAFSFDNLGGNMLYKLPQSFRATNYCRICTVEYTEAQTMILEKEEYLRSEILNIRPDDEYFCRKAGCKQETILSELLYFDQFECLSVDIAHDILEGIGQLEIKLFLQEVIEKKKLISLDDVNKRIYNFNYGQNEIKNKPSPISLNKKGYLIGQRAAQTRCLLMFLPLILSDIIEKAQTNSDRLYQQWEVLALLLQIMQIVFSPYVTQSMIPELRELILKHHSQFLEFLGKHLIPKHHILVHYPLVLKLMGPLIFLWTLRFEGKHNYFKNLIKTSKNFINIIKSFAEQHQKFIYEKWMDNNKKVEPTATAKTGKYVRFVDLISKNGMNEITNPLNSWNIENVYEVKQLHFQIDFKIGSFVAKKEVTSEFPTFFKIIALFIASDKGYAICEQWITLEFNEIYVGYKVTYDTSNMKTLFDLNELTHVVAYDLHQTYHTTDYYIIPKYRIL